jgi:hypothetical protein
MRTLTCPSRPNPSHTRLTGRRHCARPPPPPPGEPIVRAFGTPPVRSRGGNREFKSNGRARSQAGPPSAE